MITFDQAREIVAAYYGRDTEPWGYDAGTEFIAVAVPGEETPEPANQPLITVDKETGDLRSYIGHPAAWPPHIRNSTPIGELPDFEV